METVSIVFNELMKDCRDLFTWLYWDYPASEESEGVREESIKTKHYELIH